MKKLMLVALVVLIGMGIAMAAVPTPTFGNDVLGAHNGYGRGCVMCHAPHNGANENNLTTTDTTSGEVALWGEDVAPLYGKTLGFSGDGTPYQVTLPSSFTGANRHDGATIIMLCLSCHDGVSAKGAMMQGKTYETQQITGGNPNTLLGADQEGYLNDHPVGPNANVGCGSYDWDCTGGGNSSTPLTMGANQKIFATTNYTASFWYNYATAGTGYPLQSFTANNTANGVSCTTCHDQHSMTVYSNASGSYPTMFFIKGEYQPNTGGNSVAQFCRNCHGGESNEMHGLTNVPTT